MKLILLMTLLFIPIQAQATQIDLLLEVICLKETRGHSQPKWAVGSDPGDWGFCQVRYESAWRYGGFDEQMRKHGAPSRSPGDLFEPRVNIRTARNILKYCVRKIKERTAYRLAFCYKGGPNTIVHKRSRHFPYAKQVATTYAAVFKWRNRPGIRLAHDRR